MPYSLDPGTFVSPSWAKCIPVVYRFERYEVTPSRDYNRAPRYDFLLVAKTEVNATLSCSMMEINTDPSAGLIRAVDVNQPVRAPDSLDARVLWKHR